MTATKIAPRQKSHHIKMSREDKIYNIVGIILFTIITLLCVYPFYYLMICTISDQKLVDLNQIILLPKGINFENYVEIFKVQNLGNAAFISVARTVITTALSLVLTSYMAYFFTKQNMAITSQSMASIWRSGLTRMKRPTQSSPAATCRM